MTRRGPQIVVTHSVVDALTRDILLRIAFLQIKTTGRRMGIVATHKLSMTGVVAFLGPRKLMLVPHLSVKTWFLNHKPWMICLV